MSAWHVGIPSQKRMGSLQRSRSRPHSTISLFNGTYSVPRQLNWNPIMLRKCFAHKDRMVLRLLTSPDWAVYAGVPHGWVTFEQLSRMIALTWQPID